MLRKNDSTNNRKSARRNKTSRYVQVSNKEPFLLNHTSYDYRMIGNNMHALPVQAADMLSKLENHIRIVDCGCKIGDTQMRKFLPELSLALCTRFNQDAFRSVALSYDDALVYLRGGTTLPSIDVNETFVYYFDELPLGFAKKIGNRINNYYPGYAIIRMQST
ncbi:MAG: hypothetical protein IPO27_09160 [Bacteroidetes bacterium]|nr:hypothetical protein [Bacteroidota bacterium]